MTADRMFLALAMLLGTAVAANAQSARPPRARPVIAYPIPSTPTPPATQSFSVQSAPKPPSGFEAAPMPNRDIDGPAGPRASNDPQFSATLFNRRDQYRGEGISPNSSAQIDQERRVTPGAGFRLRMPLQQGSQGRSND